MDVSTDNQVDETISLSDVLVARDSCLPEDELWALCRECCLVLEVVNNSPDMFLTLCVTPDTVAFDQVGNVCFLDLDVEPEPIYTPPEFSRDGNGYKAHLFSLGMTLLYGAEYNVDHTTESISPELRDLLGRMTADHAQSRPDLEGVIILCEEQLCGQSSQEVCCGIGAVTGFGLSGEGEDQYIDTGGGTSYIEDISGEDFSRAESYLHSDLADTTYCDDIPDITEDVSQVESLPSSEVGETIEEVCEDLPEDGDSEMEKCHRSTVSPQSGNSSRLSDNGLNSIGSCSTSDDKKSGRPVIPDKPKLAPKPEIPSKPNHIQGNTVEADILVTEINTESESSESKVNGIDTDSLNKKVTSKVGSKSKSLPAIPKTHQSVEADSNVGLSNGVDSESLSKPCAEIDKSKSHLTTESKNLNVDTCDPVPSMVTVGEVNMDTAVPVSTKTRRSKRKQGLTIADILDSLDRFLTEEELWALCREGIAALQRKKKHLPAYLSPDTLLVRETGNVSFKAIPEEKPLEVIFMAPELQSKGELSEKTCLYGLSVTLRCAAGKKYAPVSVLAFSRDLKDLLRHLGDSSPVKRPELSDIARRCTDHSNGTGSEAVCARLFQEALGSLIEKEEKSLQPKPEPQNKDATPADNTVPTTIAKPSAFRPIPGSSFAPVKPVSIGSESGAFCPIPKKVKEKENSIPEPRIPSAFSSPATHFKPIILQQTSAADTGKAATVKEESEKVKEKDKVPVSSQKKSSPDSNPSDKDKEVVKKLKELKKNLMKHRHPQQSIAKDLENEDGQKSDNSNKSSTPKKSSSASSASSKKSSSTKPGDKHSRRGTGTGGEALDSLLKEIQKQGRLPDTHSLASAIAMYLQGQLSTKDGGASKPAQPDLDMTVTSAQLSPQQVQGQILPDLNIPSQYHSELVGQMMTLPLQQAGGAGVIVGSPMQVQLQQDPVTGYIQLVPIVPMRAPSVHSNAGSVRRDSLVSPAGSGKDSQSFHTSPKVPTSLNQNESFTSAISNKSDSSSANAKSKHGRTAKDLVHKTANLRAKNLGLSPGSNFQSPTDNSGMHKWKSDCAIHTGEEKFYSDGDGRVRNATSSHMMNRQIYDDYLLHVNPHRVAPHFVGPNGVPFAQYRSPEEIHRHRTHSNSSSPSPSKDSGVSGMNIGGFIGAGKPLLPATDVSLMDRLLSNVNVNQQQTLGHIIHLLREEFAFDGYMENGVEDLAMAEYVLSLGVLKWETFTSAICEKYSDLYWGDELLANLYNAANSSRPPPQHRSQPNVRSITGANKQVPPTHQDDDSSSLSDHHDITKPTANNLYTGLPPLSGGRRPRSAQVINHTNMFDTSDSTDNENYAKRRRFKTKHQLDRAKSSSASNLVQDSGSLSLLPESTVDPQSVNTNTNTQQSATLPRSNTDDNSNQYVGINDRFTTRQLSVDNRVPTLGHVETGNTTISLNDSAFMKQSQNTSPGSRLIPQGQTNLMPSNNSSSSLPIPQTSLTREISISSHSSSQSDFGDSMVTEKKGHVVYHWTMIQLSMTTEVERFMQGIDEQNSKTLLAKLATIQQEIKMERRVRRKTQKFYKNMIDANKNIIDPGKGDKSAKDERNTVSQVAKDITEMTTKVNMLDLCRTHLQMLLAELQGIDISYLYSVALCPVGDPLQLRPRPDNPLLQFQTLREPQSGIEIQALHAGTPDGLMAYLFASTALSDGYVHQFLFCYRYFTTACDVMQFLVNRYVSAARAGSTEANITRLKQRVVDMLHFWLEGYYSIDFQHNGDLLNMLRAFIKDHIIEESEGGQCLITLLGSCARGSNLELSSADPDEAEMHFWQREEPKLKWQSLKSLVGGKSAAKNKQARVQISAVVVERRRHIGQIDAPAQHVPRRSDTFTLLDYTSQQLAEQLSLVEQGIFQLAHPVHYLDSQFRGVGVAMTMPGLKTPSVTRRNAAGCLFLQPLHDMSAIEKMICHSQDVSHWVAAEIVGCSNPKSQLAVLTKFLYTAQACNELRNFATSMAILDGLENLIVKQLPAWKNLATKCISIMEELEASRMFLKNDPMSLMQQGKDCHRYPTIPSVLVFLLHVQQLEIGGFKLANQMYKWGKIRSIAQVIDQVRIFREHIYGFEADHSLQDTLRQRINEMGSQDIHTLAAQHNINYQKISSGSGISGAFRKMKGRLQSKS